MIEINHDPDVRTLRQFSGLFIVAFGIFGGLTLYRTGNLGLAAGIWTAATLIGVVGFLVPAFMRYVYVGMMYLAFPIGWVVSHVVLAIVLYGLMTPIGLIIRLAGRDPMHRRPDRKATTYWNEHNPTRSLDGYFRQF